MSNISVKNAESVLESDKRVGADQSNTSVLEKRIAVTSTLFTGSAQYENFNRYYDIYPSSKVAPAAVPWEFAAGQSVSLPEQFTFLGQTLSTEAFLADTETAALIVLKDGLLCHESYALTGGRDVQWLSMSVAKSIISALIGIAIEEGCIKSIEQAISDYVPELAGSAYEGVRIKDVLQMSSGASWSENYSDRQSDVIRFVTTFGRGDSLNQFTASLTREFAPGTVNRYNSADTQALGMLLKNATGQTITQYTQEKLWQPMGAQSEAYWLHDNDGMEMAFGGFNATALDYAKVGELFRQNGVANGQQIVPAAWVKASVTPDGTHVQPGQGEIGEFSNMGYGYQWWVPPGDAGEFSAVGVYNQSVYVNPKHKVVIMKLSANRNYATTTGEASKRQMATIEMFRAITAQL